MASALVSRRAVAAVLAGGALVLGCEADGAAPDPADQTPSEGRAAPLPRDTTEVAGTAWDGQLVAIGGFDGDGNAVADVDVYDPAADAWTRGPDLPVALHHTAVATLGGRLYVVGGYSLAVGGAWVAEDAVWSLGAGEDAWRPEPSLATARGALAVASTGDGLVAIGGVDRDGQVLTSTEVLAEGVDAWRDGPALGTAREHLAATAVDGEVYAIAGRQGGMASNLDSVEVLRSDAWEDAGTLAHRRGGIGAATVAGTPCVVGGEEPGGTIGSIECLRDDGWQVVAELEAARHGLVVAAVDGVLHVVGGGRQPGLFVSDDHEVVAIDPP